MSKNPRRTRSYLGMADIIWIFSHRKTRDCILCSLQYHSKECSLGCIQDKHRDAERILLNKVCILLSQNSECNFQGISSMRVRKIWIVDRGSNRIHIPRKLLSSSSNWNNGRHHKAYSFFHVKEWNICSHRFSNFRLMGRKLSNCFAQLCMESMQRRRVTESKGRRKIGIFS